MPTAARKGVDELRKELYYDPKEAQNALGLSKSRFEYLVEIGIIQSANVANWPYRTKLFLRSYINMLARTWEAALLAGSQSQLEFRQARGKGDLENELNLVRLVFGKLAASPLLRKAREEIYEKSPQSTYHLYDFGILVALINLVPMADQAIERLVRGEWWVSLTEDILPFTPGKPCQCFLVDFVVTPVVEPGKRTFYASRLLDAFSQVCTSMGQMGIEVTTIYSVDEGRNLLKQGNFEFLGKMGRRKVYRLDITRSGLNVIKDYKLALKRWKAEHEQSST